MIKLTAEYKYRDPVWEGVILEQKNIKTIADTLQEAQVFLKMLAKEEFSNQAVIIIKEIVHYA